MSNTIGSAVIEVGVDSSGVDAGFARIDGAVTRTGKTLESLGGSANNGFNQIGAGGDNAAKKVDAATRYLASSIQRTTAAMESGKKGSAAYFEALANSRGANMETLRPYLAQLDALASKTRIAAEAQQKLDDSTKFLESLRSRADGIGKTASQLAEMRAAQLGVSESARPLIERMREAEESAGGLGGALSSAAGALKAFAIGAAGALSFGALVAGVKGAIDTLAELDDMAQKTGSTVENLSRLQKVASMTGVEFGSVDSAVSKLAKGMATVDSETSKVQKALKAVGVSSKDAAGNLRDPSEVLVDVAKNLQNYADGAGKTALATDLLGKAGADLLPYMNDVAESVDKFAGSSTDAAHKASELQDQFGLIRVKTNELFNSVATDLLPTFNDFIGALIDTRNESAGLYADGSITSWADDVAVGLARVIDVAKIIPSIITTVGSSIGVMAADIGLMASAAKNLNPFSAGKALLKGENPLDEFKKSVDARQKILDDSNKKYDDLWNKPANTMEQAILAKIDARTGVNLDARDMQLKQLANSANKAAEAGKKALDYTTGNPQKKSNTTEEISDYEKLTSSIKEKIAASEMELTVGHALSESEKIQSKMMADMATGKIKLTNAERDAELVRLRQLDTLDKSINASKQIAKLYAAAAQTTQTAIDNASKEADKNEELAKTFGMTKTAIEQLELARLEDQLAQRSSVGMTLDEIEVLEKLIAAKKRNAAAVGSIEAQEVAKKANEEMAADWKKSVEKMNDTLTDALMRGFDSGKGYAKNLRDSVVNMFKTMVLRPIVSAIVMPAAGALTGMMGVSGAAQAADGAVSAAGGLASTVNMFSAGKTLWEGFSGGMAAMGTLGTGFMGSISGGLMGAGVGSGLTSGIGLAIGEGISSVVGSTVASGIAAGMSGIAAALPWVAAGAAVVKVLQLGFGHGERKTTSQGIEGSFGADGFTGTAFRNWKEEGGWFSSDRKGKQTPDLDAATQKQFTDGFTSIKSVSSDFAKSLGIDATSIAAYSQNISLILTDDKDKNQAAITKLFSDMGDTLATTLAPNIAEFSKYGESSSATLQRLSVSLSGVNAMFDTLNLKLYDVSIAGGDMASKLVDLFGGLEKMQATSSAYFGSYYSEQEKVDIATRQLSKTFADLGYVMPVTNAELRKQIEAQDLTTEAGRKSYAQLMGLSGSFAALSSATEQLATSTTESANQIRQALYASADDSMRTLTASVNREKDAAKAALDAQIAIITAQKSAAETAIQIETSKNAKIASLANALKSTLDGMSLSGMEAANRMAAQAQISQALSVAKLTGVLPDSDKLANALQTVAQPSEDLFASFEDYARDFYKTSGEIADLNTLASKALTKSDSAIDIARAQLATLDNAGLDAQKFYDQQIGIFDQMLASAQSQLEVANGTQSAILSLVSAMGSFAASMAAATAATAKAQYAGTIPSTPATTSGISGLYESLLGRAPDAGGLGYWESRAAAGATTAQIADEIYRSPEYLKLNGAHANGGIASGWSLVGEDGPEIVNFSQPARVYTADQSRSMMGGGDNSELVAEMRALRAENKALSERLEAALYAIAKSNLNIADTIDAWDGAGMPAERVGA